MKLTESVVWRDIQNDRCTKQTTAFTTRDQATIQDLTIRWAGKQTQTHSESTKTHTMTCTHLTLVQKHNKEHIRANADDETHKHHQTDTHANRLWKGSCACDDRDTLPADMCCLTTNTSSIPQDLSLHVNLHSLFTPTEQETQRSNSWTERFYLNFEV